ncbi:putative tributyrin esterase [Anaerobacterium chartisolvens]|uniref:Putative tributyrin esterase n=1 Tax=Anaerobacterium chartisolvens TaxID=1297424 RepID=A0A369BD45_9FIRM|nr:alpha/beta hydrolase-fold protein [Anaerobacterium chartisolvens]RCX19479.1 putative tributyrin esterase [Anaerobacterium chartisolvens]
MAVLKMNFLSKALRMNTNITVILPTISFDLSLAGFEDTYIPGMKYQAMYLLHGGSGDDSDYVNFTNIVRYADRNKLAVIMPSVNNSCYTDYEDGTRYFTYITEELPRLCKTLFPISDKREDTFIAGLSMGSHGAMKAAMNYPERYAAVLLMSGASYRPGVPSMVKTVNGKIDFDNIMKSPVSGGIDEKINDPEYIKGTVNDVYAAAKNNVELGKKLPKVFFRVGDSDHALHRATLAEKDLREWGYETRIEVIQGMGHEWDLWDETLKIALQEWLPLRRDIIYPED